MKVSGIAGLVLAPMVMWTDVARADGYVMGAGRWTCPNVVTAWRSGDLSHQGQIAGWVLGYWSNATFNEDTPFVDKVEKAGARKIVDLTLNKCEEAGDVPLFRVVAAMVEANR